MCLKCSRASLGITAVVFNLAWLGGLRGLNALRPLSQLALSSLDSTKGGPKYIANASR